MSGEPGAVDVDVERPHVHHHGTGHRWLDLALPLAALFVSFVSIFIAWHHGQVMRELVEQNARLVQANSLPYLQLYGGNQAPTGEQRIAFTVSNQGIGPAEVRSVQVKIDGRPVADLSALLRGCCTGPNFSGITTSTLLGTMIRAGQAVDYISVPAARNAALAGELDRARTANRIQTEICYCSVFDECWINSSADNSRPRAVRQCPMPQPQYRY